MAGGQTDSTAPCGPSYRGHLRGVRQPQKQTRGSRACVWVVALLVLSIFRSSMLLSTKRARSLLCFIPPPRPPLHVPCCLAKGLCHHDFSPENVVITRMGDAAVVMDFGMVQRMPTGPHGEFLPARDEQRFGKFR